MTENHDISRTTFVDGEASNDQPASKSSSNGDSIPDMESKLRKQVAKWQSKLLDLGNRNPLINCSFNASRGVIELVTPDSETIWKQLASEGAAGSDSMRFPWRRDLVPPPPEFVAEEVAATTDDSENKKKKEWNPPLEDCRASQKFGDRDLLTPLGDRALDRRLRTLDGHAHLSLSEQGVHCLYVVFGFLKWFESVDSEVEHLSPLMLVPMSLSRNSADAPWELVEAEDDAIDNLCLRERLKQDFGMMLPPLPDIDDLEEEGARIEFLESVRQAVAANERWEVLDRCALGRFAFPKVAMWQDLGDHVDSVLTNVLCRSIGGDEQVSRHHSFGFTSPLPEAATLDDVIAPGEVKTILDCDSSQLEAIIAARKGVSFVLDGPPGTGKSQTIANIIADALSQGRRVLFVSEKVSALEVVKRRLDDCGLGDFCLECHSSKANRRVVLDELKYCLDLPVEVYDDVTPKLAEAKQRRSSLNNYVRSIHRRRPPLGLSPYELYGHVSRSHRLGHAVKSRCDLPGVGELDRARFEEWLRLLERASESSDVIRHYGQHPWRGCQLTSRALTLSDDLQHHLGVLATALASIDQAVSPLVRQELLANEPTLSVLNGIVQSFREALNAPHIPSDWLLAPRKVATTVLQRCEASRILREQRTLLRQFTDEVESIFPEDTARLSVFFEPAEWEKRFLESVPQTVRQQQSFLDSKVRNLRSLSETAEKVAEKAAAVIGAFPVPIRAELPPHTFPALINLAKLVARVHPLRPDLLRAENWPKLRAGSQAALVKLDEAASIEKRLDGRLGADQILKFHQTAAARPLLDSRLSDIQSLLTNAHVDELNEFRKQLDEAVALLHEIQTLEQAVLKEWGIDRETTTSLSQILSLLASIPLCLEMVDLSGLWRDSTVRSKLQTGCEAVISDLREAAELREQLEAHLSHRAFKAPAVDLLDQAPSYQSLLKKRFGSYRQEVSESPQTAAIRRPLDSRLRTVESLLANAHRDELTELRKALDEAVTLIQEVQTNVDGVLTELGIDWETSFALSQVRSLVASIPLCLEMADLSGRWRDPAARLKLQAGCEAAIGDLREAAELREQLEERLSHRAFKATGVDLANRAPAYQSVWKRFFGGFGSYRQEVSELFKGGCPATPIMLAELLKLRKWHRRMAEVADTANELASLLPTTFANDQLESWIRLQKSVTAFDRFAISVPDIASRLPDQSVAINASTLRTLHSRLSSALERLQLLENGRLKELIDDRVPCSDLVGQMAELSELSVDCRNAYEELAPLFKGSCPAILILLAEVLKLRTWHRRMADVADTAAEIAPFLPPAFATDQLECWLRLQKSVTAFDRFANAVPEITSRLSDHTVAVNSSALKSLHGRLSSSLERFEQLQSGRLRDLIDVRVPYSNVIERLTELSESSAECQGAFQELTPLYLAAPRTLKTLAEDCRLTKCFAERLAEVAVQHRLMIDLLPFNASATDRAMWQRVERSVLAAERLAKLAPSLADHHDKLCKPELFDAAAFGQSATELEVAHRSFCAALQVVAPQIQLLSEPLAPEELIRRPLADVRLAVQSALASMEERYHLLTSLLPALCPDSDVAVESLPAVADSVERIRSSSREYQGCQAVLREWKVDPEFELNEDGHAEATWLLEQRAAGKLTPLTQAVATSSEVREQVKHGLDVCKTAWSSNFSNSFKFLRKVFDLEAETGQGVAIASMPISMLSNFLRGLCTSLGSLDEWLKFSRWKRDMSKEGFGGVVDELLSGLYEPEETKSVISARYFRLVFDHLADEDQLVGEFDLETHEQARERFRKLDKWEVEVAATRIRQYQLGRNDRPRLEGFTASTSELGILQREIQKKRRQLPLRKLFAEIPSVLQQLKPCVMMSPLSVSTFLQSDELRFDLVVFDEASQVFPWDAIGAIYRGNQLIVAGDEKQLPPTNFFNRADLESADDDESDIGDFESILSLCKSIGMPGKGLRWHYRSRRESLIAFSNRHFYSGDLVTFPSILDASSDAVRLEFVPQGRWIDRTNLPEAERVTDLVIRHLRTRPKTSLGIIAFNQSQQSAIEDAIYDRRRKYPEIESLFHIGNSEPLFVKNLENVQGDERDIIILSMGYGYNEAGKFLKNFGPITKSGGERRLNVAVTRAREEVILVASVKSADLDLSGSTSLGSHLLKGYLDYAERGVDSLARQIDSITAEAESTFEQEVAAALIARGLHPAMQVGCGGFRIDMALKHPQRPGEFCLGIECDGATYHSSNTARDRDRIRQNVLENLGWKIIRIWSTDWIRNPERQIDRLLAAYERATTTSAVRPTKDETTPDEDLADLTPRFEISRGTVSQDFNTIKDVSEYHLRETFQNIVKRGGAIDREGLIQQTSRALGFARTGKQIRQRLEYSLNDLLQVGLLRWIGERIAYGSDEAT